MASFVETSVYLFEIIKCLIVSYYVLGLREREGKRKYIAVLVVLMCSTVTFVTGEYNAFMYFITIALIVYLCFEEKITLIIFCIILEYLTISFVDLLMWIVMVGITPLGAHYNENETLIYLVGNLVGIAPWIIITLFQMRKNIRLREIFEQLKITGYALIIMIVLALMFITACLQGAFLDEMTMGGQRLVLLTSVLFSFFVVALCILYVYVADGRNKISEINALNEACIKYQAEYYNNVMRKDEELRAFRHDANKHYNSLKALYTEKRYDQLGEYLDRLVESIEVNNVYRTGNLIADYIINGKIKELSGYNVKTNIVGKFPPDIKLNDTEISVILSNILDNAKEAIMECEDAEKILDIEIKNYKDILYITVKNSSPYRSIRNGTTKDDKENHGYGLKNVQYVLDKYDGVLEMSWKDNIYSTEISL